jgi:hypothetical protein
MDAGEGVAYEIFFTTVQRRNSFDSSYRDSRTGGNPGKFDRKKGTSAKNALQ